MKRLHDESASPAATGDDTAQLAVETGVRLMRVIRHAVRSAPSTTLPLSRLRALSYLADNPGICLSELAEYLFVGVPTASKVVDDLVERGLLKRVSDTQDRRRLALTATAKGQRVLETASQPAQEQVGRHLAALSSSDRAKVRTGLLLLRNALQPAERGANV